MLLEWHTVCHDSGNIKDPIQTIGWFTLVMSRLFEWCTRLSYVLCLHCLHMNLTEVWVCVQYVNRLELFTRSEDVFLDANTETILDSSSKQLEDGRRLLAETEEIGGSVL